MKTILINTYTISELKKDFPDSYEKVINNYSDWNTNGDWWGFIYEDAETIGLEITSFDLDRNKYAKGDFTVSPETVIERIEKEHGKDCETYKTAQQYKKLLADENEADRESIGNVADEFKSALLEDYASILQKEFDYLTSEESILESLECNDYYFTLDGKLV